MIHLTPFGLHVNQHIMWKYCPTITWSARDLELNWKPMKIFTEMALFSHIQESLSLYLQLFRLFQKMVVMPPLWIFSPCGCHVVEWLLNRVKWIIPHKVTVFGNNQIHVNTDVNCIWIALMISTCGSIFQFNLISCQKTSHDLMTNPWHFVTNLWHFLYSFNSWSIVIKMWKYIYHKHTRLDLWKKIGTRTCHACNGPHTQVKPGFQAIHSLIHSLIHSFMLFLRL